MITLENPILKGFNPDPSIIRVGADYYLATSTFEWFPGVQIHHSKDLVNWTLIARPLNRLDQLDLRGVPDSGGVWAPCLSYDDGTFYLVYSNVNSFQGVWKDTPNYLVTTKDIRGEWSAPIFLGSSGFDGSMYHGEDGKKWYLSMLVDHRKGKFFGGIIMQEYDPSASKLIGQVHYLFEGTELGCTEGPHLYKVGAYYYLVLAEGGTEYGHAVTVARATSLFGPYELHPDNPIATARDLPEAPLQKTGHADLVVDEEGNWFIVMLAGRPLNTRGRCILGRETVLESIEWKNDWPYLSNGTKLIRTSLQIDKAAMPTDQTEGRVSFSSSQLAPEFQSLRIPVTADWCSLTAREGYLRLYGQASLSSLHRQSMIARRLQSFHCEVSVGFDFRPTNFQQMAGLVAYYNTYHWHYLQVSGSNEGKRYLQVMSCDKYQITESLTDPIELPPNGLIELRMHWQQADLQYYYRKNGVWVAVGPVLDASILSDDYVQHTNGRYRPAFTGAFVGMCCQDLTGQGLHADFSWWDYQEI